MKKQFVIYPQPDIPTINGRIYPKGIYEKAIHEYLEKQVKTGRAVCSTTVDKSNPYVVHLNTASLMIDDLKKKNDIHIASIRILETPEGKILKILLDAGAVDSLMMNGVGSLNETKDGVMEVGEDYKLISFSLEYMNPENDRNIS